MAARCLGIATIAATLLLNGCARELVKHDVSSILAEPHLPPDSVVFDYVSLRVPQDDEAINDTLWSELDEQQVAPEIRRRLAANGFRVGVASSRLPLALDERIHADAPPPVPNDEPSPVNLEQEPLVRQWRRSARASHPMNIIVTGEATRHEELSILLRDDDGQVTGRTYRSVLGLFRVVAHPHGDGRVRVEVVPEIEHGDPEKRYTASDGVLRMEFGPPRVTLDKLAFEVWMSPGQSLVLTSLPKLEGSIGQQFFADQLTGLAMQKVVLLRLAGTQNDDRFQSNVVATP